MSVLSQAFLGFEGTGAALPCLCIVSPHWGHLSLHELHRNLGQLRREWTLGWHATEEQAGSWRSTRPAGTLPCSAYSCSTWSWVFMICSTTKLGHAAPFGVCTWLSSDPPSIIIHHIFFSLPYTSGHPDSERYNLKTYDLSSTGGLHPRATQNKGRI